MRGDDIDSRKKKKSEIGNIKKKYKHVDTCLHIYNSV